MSGPEIPFPMQAQDEPGIPFPMLPLDTEDYKNAADQFGFSRDYPFPSNILPHHLELTGSKLQRRLGIGSYTAHAIAGVVTITAIGIAPNLNTIVQLVQLPLMVWPPRYVLYFTDPEFTLPATHPFRVQATLMTHERVRAILVEDADGVHAVEVESF